MIIFMSFFLPNQAATAIMPPSKFTTPRFTSFLHTPELETLAQRASMLRQLEQVLHDLLPKTLAQNTRVQALTAGRLSLLCQNPAHAAKLRQLGARIKEGFTARGFEVTAIQVETQASHQAAYAPAKPAAARELSGAARQAFDALEQTLPDSELRQAIKKLLSAK